MCALCHESAVACAPPAVGLPADVLEALRLCCVSQLQMSTDRGGRAGGPGTFPQSPSGMGMTGLGDRTLPASLGPGGLRGHQPQELHERSWLINTRQVTHGRHPSHGPGALYAAQGWQRLDHRGQPPGVDVLAEFVLQPLEACGVCSDGTDLFLKNNGLSGRGADHFRTPPEVGRAPMSPACVTDVVPEQAGWEAKLGIFEIAHGVFPCPGEIAHSLIVDCGDRDRGQIP